MHDPLVKKDDLLSRYRNTFLINDLDLAFKGADLIMVIADHNEYRKLNSTNIGKSALYDGRGITMEDNLHGVRHVMIGNLN